MMDSQRTPVFINSILEPGKDRPRLVAQTIDVGAQRQIRRHKKSRRGCVGCKLRKVRCDERRPCSSCLKRSILCIPPIAKDSVSSIQGKPIIGLRLDANPDMSLLQLELFHHWDKHTRSTLVYPEIWPIIMQQAFQENFIMAAILCTSSMHLSTLHPQNTRYSQFARQLMPHTISLFRQNLSRALTKCNSEAIVGAALLVNYISWFDVSFLDGHTNTVGALAHDQLLLVSSGVVHAWFQTIPILIEGKSAFIKVMIHHPRLIIEQTLAKRGDETNLFMQPLMDIWDDSRYETSGGCTTDTTAHEPATNGAWRLLQGLETELVPADPLKRRKLEPCNELEKLLHYKEKVTKITKGSIPANNPVIPSEVLTSLQARASFEYIVRRISPLLRCQALVSSSSAEIQSDMTVLRENIEGFIYGFPILCCGPFTDLVQRRDTRALVLLLHFYRSAGVLLDPRRCWWGVTRSCIMENLIVDELGLRGVSTSVADHNYNETIC